jgi:peptide deformylase
VATREIIKLGHPTLSKKSESVAGLDDEVRTLIRDMIETVHKAPGIGLSAPQVDVLKRIIVVDLSMGENPDDLHVLVNPEILRKEGKLIREEGCLSVPEIYEKVARPQKVTVRGLDPDGGDKTIEAEDLLARAFCHEIDHLDGRLFVDLLSPLKRSLIKKKFKKPDAKKKS